MIFVAPPWNNLGLQKGARRGCADQGRKRHRVTRPCNQHWLGEEVWVLVLRTCSVTWGCHNLLHGDSERVSLTGVKKQTKTSEKHINIIVINIY